jgi:hypothetical protein
LQPALTIFQKQLETINQIADANERQAEFRRLPALEFFLESTKDCLSPAEQESFAQSDRAKRSRVRLNAARMTISGVVETVVQANSPHLAAKQYWLPFFWQLKSLGCDPTLAPDPAQPSVEKIEYCDHNGKRRSLGTRQFANIVSQVKQRIQPRSH